MQATTPHCFRIRSMHLPNLLTFKELTTNGSLRLKNDSSPAAIGATACPNNNRMPEFLKSKLGVFLAGIYLLLVVYALIEYSVQPPVIMGEFALFILTAPWSFLLLLLLENLGITVVENYPLFYFSVVLGGLINAATLFFVGYFVTKLFRFLASIKPKA